MMQVLVQKMAKTSKASGIKKDAVKELVTLFKKYPIVAAVNMESLPARQLQTMRENLRDGCVIRMAKRRLIKIAIKKAQKDMPGLEKLEENLRGMPALLFTDKNPFTLYKNIQKNKSSAPAKAGQTAPNDIKVPAGPTPFAPGPVIGELGGCGIKAGIDAGKVVIKEDAIVVKEGEVVSAQLAGILTRLGIEPMEIGLNVTAVYENGTVFGKDVLAIDEQEFLDKLAQAGAWAINLGVEAGIYTDKTTELLLTKAFRDAKGLAVSQGILSKEVVADVLAKAEREAATLKDQVKE